MKNCSARDLTKYFVIRLPHSMTHANKYSDLFSHRREGERGKGKAGEWLRFMVSSQSCAGMMMMESEKNWRDDIAKTEKYNFFQVQPSFFHISPPCLVRITFHEIPRALLFTTCVKLVFFFDFFPPTALSQLEDRWKTTQQQKMLNLFSESLKSVASKRLEWRLHVAQWIFLQH